MPKTKKSAFERITKNLGKLTLAELEELSLIVNQLKEVLVEESKEPIIEPEKKKKELIKKSIKQAREGRKVTIGYLEEKMINGYGPYLYFRYWEEGIHRSLYIGKKES